MNKLTHIFTFIAPEVPSRLSFSALLLKVCNQRQVEEKYFKSSLLKHINKALTPFTWARGILPLFTLALFVFLCQPALASNSSVLKSVKNANAPFNNNSIDSVTVITEKTVPSKVKYRDRTFQVLARKKHIQRFKCSTCHIDKIVEVFNGAELTHGNVTINHGSDGNELTCIDCHHEEDRDYLEDKKGRKIDFDHSYQLCGQCHFRQKRDWIGGAHGKRVDYWAGPRVIRNCATCHNPHSPRFEKRLPATYSRPLD